MRAVLALATASMFVFLIATTGNAQSPEQALLENRSYIKCMSKLSRFDRDLVAKVKRCESRAQKSTIFTMPNIAIAIFGSLILILVVRRGDFCDEVVDRRPITSDLKTVYAPAPTTFSPSNSLLDEFDEDSNDIEDDRPDRSESPWEAIDVPPNRPEGDWVNWKFGSGWIRVKGTQANWADVSALIDDLEFCPADARIETELEREPDNPIDQNAVKVGVFTVIAGKTAYRIIGHLDRDAARWLAHNFSADMPIAAELVRVRTNHSAAAIDVCALMPRKKAREQYELT